MTEHEIRFEAALKEALQQTLMAEYTPAPGEVLPKPSRRMRRMMRPLLRDPFGRKRRARRRVGRVAAGVAAAFVVVFSMTLAFSEEARAKLQQFIVEVKEYFTSIQFIQSAETPVEELGNWEPTWLPEGYELVQEYDLMGHKICIYRDNDGKRIRFAAVINQAGLDRDNEFRFAKEIQIGGDIGYLIQAENEGERSSLSWYNEENSIVFSVIAELSEEEIVKIAESVRIVE